MYRNKIWDIGPVPGGGFLADSFPVVDLEMRVTWGDSDPAGISYYARTFDWFTNGRMNFFRSYGFPYMETFHGQGIALINLHADCDYKKMVRPGEKIFIRTSLTDLSRTRMTFTYQVIKEDGPLAEEGKTLHAFTDFDGKPFNLKKRFPVLWEQMVNEWEMLQQ